MSILCILVILSVSWFGWSGITERFEKIVNTADNLQEVRVTILNDSKNIIQDFPLTGTGFGSFMHIYPKYRSFTGEKTVKHAHNDFLELLTDGGIISVILAGWFLISVFSCSFRVFRKRFEDYSIYLFIGASTGIFTALVHGLYYFNMHVGANGLYFFFLLGLMVSASHTRLREGLNNTYLTKLENPPLKKLFVMVVMLFLFCAAINAGIFYGEMVAANLENEAISKETGRNRLIELNGIADRAIRFDPLEARHYHTKAGINSFLFNNLRALDYYRKAGRLNPSNGEYLQSLGLMMSLLSEQETADKFFRTGIRYDFSNPARYRAYASWLLTRGEKEMGLNYVNKAITLEPENTKLYITLMVLNRLNDTEILESLPQMTEPHILFSDYLLRTGNEEMAEDSYELALNYVDNEKNPGPSSLYTIYSYYRKKRLFDRALTVMKKAVEVLPGNPWIRIAAGTAYEEAGIPYRAKEEYRKALILDPENKAARSKLDEIK
jgi:tetratricopeptide (TPR) repeat protein